MDTIFLERLLGKARLCYKYNRQNPKNKFFYIPINLKEEHWEVLGDNISNLKMKILRLAEFQVLNQWFLL